MVEKDRLTKELGNSVPASNDRVDEETNSPSSSTTIRPV